MEEKYRRSYQRLLDRYNDWPISLYRENSAIELINTEIYNFKREHKNFDVRPDAEYFLLLNFHQMVALPLIIGNNIKINDQSEPTPIQKINDAIIHDIAEILRGATEEANNYEISAHSVIQSLNKRWERLETMSFKLWHRYDD